MFRTYHRYSEAGSEATVLGIRIRHPHRAFSRAGIRESQNIENWKFRKTLKPSPRLFRRRAGLWDTHGQLSNLFHSSLTEPPQPCNSSRSDISSLISWNSL